MGPMRYSVGTDSTTTVLSLTIVMQPSLMVLRQRHHMWPRQSHGVQSLGFVQFENILWLVRQISWSLETETSVEDGETTQ